MKWQFVAIGTTAVVAAALGGVAIYAKPAIKTGTGYAALNACGVELVAQRSSASSAGDLPDNPLVPHLKTTVTPDSDASSTLWGGLYRQTAYLVPGSGCTLSDTKPSLAALKPIKAPHPNRLWPEGNDVRPKESALSSDQREQLERAIDAAFGQSSAEEAQLGTRGVVIVHDGRIVAERYADGFTANTRQLGWSMSKSTANLLTGRLVREGKLTLDDAALFPEWTDERKNITINHLLTMTDGLDWQETYDIGSPATEMLYVAHSASDYAAKRDLEHPPGTQQKYSSAATNLLCRALHDKSGQGHNLARDVLFEPLGMASAVMSPDYHGRLVCSSHMWATARDWARMGLFALNQGEWDGTKLLPDRWMELSRVRPQVPTDDEALASSWRTNTPKDGKKSRPLLPDDAYWAAGHDGQRMLIVPSAKIVVVRLGLSSHDINPSVDALTAAAISATK